MEEMDVYTRITLACEARDKIDKALQDTPWEKDDVQDLFMLRQKIEAIIWRVLWEK